LLRWGREPVQEYDAALHEVQAATQELRDVTRELRDAAQPYLNTRNPLIALTITLLNDQQMRPDDDKPGT
jgi:hypothetical protein